mmetsp:Transcript_49879/g.159553  ORF Transcript_49879/g.159553 Transcript_49879/m.159553 type:complete len:215 (+) Transcript_49879:1178-1822(+)
MKRSNRLRSQGNQGSASSLSWAPVREREAKRSKSQLKVPSSAAARAASKTATGASTCCSHQAQKCSACSLHEPAASAWASVKRAVGTISHPASRAGMKMTASSDLEASASHSRPAQCQRRSAVSPARPCARAKARWCRFTQSRAQVAWRMPSSSGDRKKPTKVPEPPPVSTALQAPSGVCTRCETGSCPPFRKARMFPWRSCPAKETWSPGART